MCLLYFDTVLGQIDPEANKFEYLFAQTKLTFLIKIMNYTQKSDKSSKDVKMDNLAVENRSKFPRIKTENPKDISEGKFAIILKT